MKTQFKEYVKPFKIWESENFSKINEKKESDLSEEQLKDYTQGVFYNSVLTSSSNFNKFIKGVKSVGDLWKKIKSTLGSTDNSVSVIVSYMMQDFIRIYLQCLDSTLDIKLGSDATYMHYSVGSSNKYKTSKTRSYKKPIINIKKTGEKEYVTLSIDDLIDDFDTKFPNGIKLSNGKILSEYLGGISDADVPEKINSNFDKVLKDSDNTDIVKNIENIKKEIEKGEDKILTQAKRTAQSLLKGFGF